MGGVLCAAPPTRHACNDPACACCDKASEQQLVSDKGRACRMARYCCMEHQHRHWRAHKSACRALAAAAAAAAVSGGQASSSSKTRGEGSSSKSPEDEGDSRALREACRRRTLVAWRRTRVGLCATESLQAIAVALQLGPVQPTRRKIRHTRLLLPSAHIRANNASGLLPPPKRQLSHQTGMHSVSVCVLAPGCLETFTAGMAMPLHPQSGSAHPGSAAAPTTNRRRALLHEPHTTSHVKLWLVPAVRGLSPQLAATFKRESLRMHPP
jgi:hypothetical protein